VSIRLRWLKETGQPYQGRGSTWFYEYDLGADTPKLDRFRQADHTYRNARRQWAGKGHEIASALAADHEATLGENRCGTGCVTTCRSAFAFTAR
jgi:hypothetical protein